jgi:sugar lactone lactonase YvrE
VALGTLRGAPPLSPAEVNLALFLFGAEPESPLAIGNPTGMAVEDQAVLICDTALSSVLRWDAVADQVSVETFTPALLFPFAIAVMPSGERLICDRQGAHRVTPDGHIVCTYRLAGTTFKPGGILDVGDEVWVTNLTDHRIEVFDAASGAHRRSTGEPGREPAQFALPTGLAHLPDGNVCVVDTLNNRVQVLDPQGRWVRSIGGPGDSAGRFGRPKDVAVGPDGVVFVTDAFSQRVHVFAPDGQTLLVFGEPGSGPGALTLPSGIAISTVAPRTDQPLPPDTSPAYYVLVAEQLDRPGIRVYAWLSGSINVVSGPVPSREATAWRPSFPGSTAVNPHWDPTRCTSCHTETDQRMLPIAPEASDALCLSCHDGQKAPADPHPIGRDAKTELVDTPADFPTFNNVIGCLTCHDIQRHCSPTAKRPEVNYVLLRRWDPQRPLEYCSNCHHTGVEQRFSPHRQRDTRGRIREDACLFCHTQLLEVPADGRRRFQPHLREETSRLCLNCHTRHWDLSPRGHVDRLVTPKIREWILMRELSLSMGGDLQQLARVASEAGRQPARLPLGRREVAGPGGHLTVQEIVTCYTCHNPHYAGMFPPNSEVGALATNAPDRKSALRTNWIDLCSECHQR